MICTQKLMVQKLSGGSKIHHLGTNIITFGTNTFEVLLGTKVYLLKGSSPSDSFCTFFLRVC